jgi:hypothetical protein
MGVRKSVSLNLVGPYIRVPGFAQRVPKTAIVRDVDDPERVASLLRRPVRRGCRQNTCDG